RAGRTIVALTAGAVATGPLAAGAGTAVEVAAVLRRGSTAERGGDTLDRRVPALGSGRVSAASGSHGHRGRGAGGQGRVTGKDATGAAPSIGATRAATTAGDDEVADVEVVGWRRRCRDRLRGRSRGGDPGKRDHGHRGGRGGATELQHPATGPGV